ncbi:MAG: thioredoxin family protein [Breznakibacter sp.]|nr:thioredoxin family protein [Breznakibacter sp.]
MDLKETLEQHPLVLLYFSGSACSACSALKPKLEGLILSEFPLVKFVEIETSTNLELAAQHSVFTVPSALLMTEGKEAQRFVRNFGLHEVKSTLDRLYPMVYGE